MNRIIIVALLVGAALVAAISTGSTGIASARAEGTPVPGYSCDMATPAATPDMAMPGMGTPGAGNMGMMNVEFDQMYIDMMIPHHASIIALSQAALPRLTEEGLREIAQNTIDNQSAEIDELMQLREQFYGSPEPMPMGDSDMMGMMMEAMPGIGSPDEMMAQMDAHNLVGSFCAAENPDLAFIDLTIPHHEMAIAASQAALQRAVHPQIRDLATRVIEAQEAEVDQMNRIRAGLVS